MADMRIFLENTETEYGEWLDFPLYDEDVERIGEVLNEEDEVDHSASVEITKSEGFPFDVKGEDIEAVNEFVDLVENHRYMSEDEVLAVAKVMKDCWNSNLETIIDDIRSGNNFTVYRGSRADVAEQMVDEGLFGDVSDSLKPYIDYNSLGDDLRHDGCHEVDGYVVRLDS